MDDISKNSIVSSNPTKLGLKGAIRLDRDCSTCNLHSDVFTEVAAWIRVPLPERKLGRVLKFRRTDFWFL